ncbi:MAG: hypothetical protein U5K37_08780 [Natrialbaceae archaeon]|nr:hypothetical protein [Natrialbaceae archaeon]
MIGDHEANLEAMSEDERRAWKRKRAERSMIRGGERVSHGRLRTYRYPETLEPDMDEESPEDIA